MVCFPKSGHNYSSIMCASLDVLQASHKFIIANITRDQSILLFFSPIFLSSNSFFQPIMLNILLQAIYYAQNFAQNLATYNSDIMHNITSYADASIKL